MTIESALLIQFTACAAMTGIIWLIQLSIYPLFARIGPESFEDYHTRYTKSVVPVIMPCMVVEAGACAACLYLGSLADHLLPTLLLGVIWLSTAFLQMPMHLTLTREKIPRLVNSNWIRTIAWTLRSALLLRLLLSKYTLPV